MKNMVYFMNCIKTYIRNFDMYYIPHSFMQHIQLMILILKNDIIILMDFKI